VKLSKYVNYTKVNNDFVLFHSQIGNACKVDEKIFNILRNIDEHENETDIINEFKNKEMIVVSEDQDLLELKTKYNINTVKKASHIKTIQLIVSNNCNYKCKYCFENKIYCSPERERDQHDLNNKNMSPEKAVEYIETVINYLRKYNNDVRLHIQFFGGETITNKNAIKNVLDTFGNGESRNVDLTYSIVTNGSLVDDDISSYFSKYNVSVIVSFDNPKQKDRDMKSGKDSVERTYEILDVLKKYNVYTAFNSVLSSMTFDYFDTDIIDCAIEHNVKEVGIVLD